MDIAPHLRGGRFCQSADRATMRRRLLVLTLSLLLLSGVSGAKKKKKGKSHSKRSAERPFTQQQTRDAEAAKADQLFGSVGKKSEKKEEL